MGMQYDMLFLAEDRQTYINQANMEVLCRDQVN